MKIHLLQITVQNIPVQIGTYKVQDISGLTTESFGRRKVGLVKLFRKDALLSLDETPVLFKTVDSWRTDNPSNGYSDPPPGEVPRRSGCQYSF